jgi:phospholipid/cholesterol/gamma-HCH transport system substrate-binding protein
MPRTRSLAWTELKVGIVSVVAIALAGMLIFMLSGETGFAWERYPLKTTFDNVAGLGDGSPVRVAGVEVGSVTAVSFIGDRVEVTFEVAEEVSSRITTGSMASLGSVSLLGEGAVDITPSSGGTPIPQWGYVRSGKTAGSLTDVATQASAGIEQLTAILNDIRTGRGTIGQLFTNEAIHNELLALLSSADAVARNLNQGKGTLARLLNDPATAVAVEGSMKNLEALTARIRAGEGSLGKLLNDDAFATSLTSTTANLDALTGRLNKGEGTLGKLFTETQLHDRINSTMERMDKLVAALNAGEGTAGLMLRDRQLYDNMNGAIADMRTLISNISKDPKKYLNIRVSLF